MSSVTDIRSILKERKNTHGKFEDHAFVTQQFKAAMHGSPNWRTLSSVQKESLEMIVHKISRALSGNPKHKDHYIDIIGYAQLVVDDLEKETNPF